jgi:hypothetical protein
MWVFGALVWATLLWAVWLEVEPRLGAGPARAIPAGLAVIATVLAASSLIGTGLDQEREGRLMPVIDELSAAVRDATPTGEYRLVIDGSLREPGLETGLTVDLEDHGFHLRNDRGSRTVGDHRSMDQLPEGAPIGEIHVRGSDADPPAGTSLVATVDVDPPGRPEQRFWIYARSAS